MACYDVENTRGARSTATNPREVEILPRSLASFHKREGFLSYGDQEESLRLQVGLASGKVDKEEKNLRKIVLFWAESTHY